MHFVHYTRSSSCTRRLSPNMKWYITHHTSSRSLLARRQPVSKRAKPFDHRKLKVERSLRTLALSASDGQNYQPSDVLKDAANNPKLNICVAPWPCLPWDGPVIPRGPSEDPAHRKTACMTSVHATDAVVNPACSNNHWTLRYTQNIIPWHFLLVVHRQAQNHALIHRR